MASTQHCWTKQASSCILSMKIVHERSVIAIVTNLLRSFHISQDSESIIQTCLILPSQNLQSQAETHQLFKTSLSELKYCASPSRHDPEEYL